MDLNTYNLIVELIQNHKGLTKDCVPILTNKFPNIDKNTLCSILSHQFRQRMKYTYIKSPETIECYYSLYTEALSRGDSPGIILKIAEENEVAPCLVAKLILEKCLGGVSEDNEENSVINVNIYLRDTNLVEDERLAYELFLCTLYDDQYSPIEETRRMSLGQEYEIKLHREMLQLGLAFRDEEYLRKYGYDKTPDVKLEVPIAIDGFIVNWVESKALFGDDIVHKEYMRTQYLSYWNRFGPGLIIYWFGFLQTVSQGNDKRFLIRDHFPTNIIKIATHTSFVEKDNEN